MIHKLKATFIIEVFVCTGENEGTTQETTSGIGGKQQYNNVLFSNYALVLVSCIKVNSSHSLLHDTIQFQRRWRANILYIGTLHGRIVFCTSGHWYLFNRAASASN